MGARLTADDFNQLWRYFERSAFRFETLPVYRVENEQESVAKFLAGEPEPVTVIRGYREWLAQISAATARGKRVSRVRVLHEPPTDYQRWEVWSGRWNVAAGEQIRYIPYDRARGLGLPVDSGDWWLFDSSRLAQMRFGPDGTPLGGEIVSDPALIVQHNAWRDLAMQHSVESAVEVDRT